MRLQGGRDRWIGLALGVVLLVTGVSLESLAIGESVSTRAMSASDNMGAGNYSLNTRDRGPSLRLPTHLVIGRTSTFFEGDFVAPEFVPHVRHFDYTPFVALVPASCRDWFDDGKGILVWNWHVDESVPHGSQAIVANQTPTPRAGMGRVTAVPVSPDSCERMAELPLVTSGAAAPIEFRGSGDVVHVRLDVDPQRAFDAAHGETRFVVVSGFYERVTLPNGSVVLDVGTTARDAGNIVTVESAASAEGAALRLPAGVVLFAGGGLTIAITAFSVIASRRK